MNIITRALNVRANANANYLSLLILIFVQGMRQADYHIAAPGTQRPKNPYAKAQGWRALICPPPFYHLFSSILQSTGSGRIISRRWSLLRYLLYTTIFFLCSRYNSKLHYRPIYGTRRPHFDLSLEPAWPTKPSSSRFRPSTSLTIPVSPLKHFKVTSVDSIRNARIHPPKGGPPNARAIRKEIRSHTI